MPQIFGKTNNLLPGGIADGTSQQVRTSKYGDQWQVPVGAGFYGPTLEGSYFRATNPTFGTAFALNVAAATAFAETAGSIVVRNTASAAGKDLYLDYIRIWIAAAPTGNTTFDVAMQMDNANRYSSGGGAATIINANNNVSSTSVANIQVGALVTTAATASRKLGMWRLKAAIPAIADEYLFNFGAIDTVAQAPGVVKALTVGPVLLPAGSNHSFVMHLFGAAQSAAATGHLDMGWIER